MADKQGRFALAALIGDLALSGLARFTPYDFQRTAWTLLGSLGIRHELAERLVGHEVGSAVSMAYDRRRYDGKQRAAADLLGAGISRILKEE